MTDAAITGDAPVSGEAWVVETNTTIDGEVMVVNSTTNIEAHLLIKNSTITFEGNVTLSPQGVFEAHNSTIVFTGNNTHFSSQGVIELEDTTFGCPENTTWWVVSYAGSFSAKNGILNLGWMLNFASGTMATISKTSVLFRSNQWIDSALLGSQASVFHLKDSTFEREGAQNYIIMALDSTNANKLLVENCTFHNGGLPSDNPDSFFLPPETAIFANCTEVSIRDSKLLDSIGGAITLENVMPSPFYWGNISGTSIANGSFGILTMRYTMNITDCTITGMDIGVNITQTPAILVAGIYEPFALSKVSNSTISDCGTGIRIIVAATELRDNNLGKNMAHGIWGTNSIIPEGMHDNDFSNPSSPGYYPIVFDSFLYCVVMGPQSRLLSNAAVSLPGSIYPTVHTDNGHANLGGNSGLLAYTMNRYGNETYYRYTVNISYDTGVYTSYSQFNIDPLNATSSRLNVYLDAGPDLKINSVSAPNSIVPSGSTIEVVVNVTNYWWHDAVDVLITVQTDMNEGSVYVTIPANATVDVVIPLNVGSRQRDQTVGITARIDPYSDMEGVFINRGNNVLESSVEVSFTPSAEVPATGLIAAIIILLIVFFISLYRTLSSGGDEPKALDDEKADAESGDDMTDMGETRESEESGEQELLGEQRESGKSREPGESGETRERNGDVPSSEEKAVDDKQA
ncbi:MAG: hypothetical protein QCI38_01125 [Candidatus Thermoplasmatota archaeon]|nr:hypothetical protein [Candidatus Thermoplasmatota archaeon]